MSENYRAMLVEQVDRYLQDAMAAAIRTHGLATNT